MQTSESWTMLRVVLWTLAVAMLAAGIALVVVTLKTNYTTDLTAAGGTFWDFRDAGYYPVRAVLEGVVPYDIGSYFAAYPVAQEFPLLPPTYMVLHAPFQLLDNEAASIGMFVMSLAGLGALSAWSIHLGRYRVTPLAVVFVSALVIVSNGGRNMLFTGQASLVFVAGMYLALTTSGVTRGSAGVFVAMIKPGFGIPFAVLVAAAGRYRRAAIGVLAAAGVSFVLMLPLTVWAGGIGPLLDILKENAAFSAASRWVSLETTTARIDFPATVALVFDVVPSDVTAALMGIAVIAVSALVLYRRRAALSYGTSFDAAVVLVCIGTLVGVYHVFYDLVILLVPTILLTRRDFADGHVSRTLRAVMLGSLLVASFNPFRVDSIARRLPGTDRFADVLGTGLTGASLLIALTIILIVVWRLPDQRADHIERAKADQDADTGTPYDGTG